MNIRQLSKLDNHAIFGIFARARWAKNAGEPYCPKCGCIEIYWYNSRAIFKCKGCKHQFSLTSGTGLSAKKLSYRDLLMLAVLFVHSAKGISSLQLGRNLGIEQRTAYLIERKFREAIYAEHQTIKLTGEVEVDGAVFGGHRWKANFISAYRTPLKFAWRKWILRGERKVVVVARERGGRTRTFIVNKESEAVFQLNQVIDRSAVIHADGAHGWDDLKKLYKMLRINHSICYSDGVSCTNQAESFFSRLRKTQNTYHRISGPHMKLYAAETAWREDYRKDYGAALDSLLSGLMRQTNEPLRERLLVNDVTALDAGSAPAQYQRRALAESKSPRRSGRDARG